MLVNLAVLAKDKKDCLPSLKGMQSDKWARMESNHRPSDYESPALTTAPRAPKKRHHEGQALAAFVVFKRAGDRIRTDDILLGGQAFYH